MPRDGVSDLTGTGCTDEALAQLPFAPGVTGLVLDGNPVTAAGLRVLDRLPELTLVSLRDTAVGDDGALELATYAGPLRTVHLDRAGVGAAGLEVLLTAPWIPDLEVLTLAAGTGRAPFGPVLAEAGFRALRRLDLSGWRFFEPEFRKFTRAAQFATLIDLGLAQAGLGNRDVDAIATSPVLGGLRTLDLSGNSVLEQGAYALARSAHLGRLETLDLRSNSVTAAGLRALVRSTALGALRDLRCEFGRLDLDDWPEVQARFPSVPVPHHVRDYHADDPARLAGALAEPGPGGRVALHEVRIGARARELFHADPRLGRVRELVLRRNQLGDDGAAALAASTTLTGLTHLTLTGNDIGAAGLAALAGSAVLAGVVHLDLSDNPLTTAGIAALASARLPALRTLRLCAIGSAGFGPLVHLPGLDRLESLDVSGNDVSDEDRDFYDWAGPPVYSIAADPVMVALRRLLGPRLHL